MAVEMVSEQAVREAVVDVVNRLPKYKASIEKLLEVDEQNPEGKFWGEDSPTGRAWYARNSGIPNQHLGYLVQRGIVTIFWRSNSTKIYCLSHPQVVAEAMNSQDRDHQLAEAGTPRAGSRQLAFDELFQRVYGYEKVKKWCRRYLERGVNIALIGAAGSAKTVILRDIGRLANGHYKPATHFSKRAMFDFLFYSNVDYFCLDEADELEGKNWAHIYTMAWDGYIELNLKDDYRHKELSPVMVIGLNDVDRLPEAIRRRFKVIRMDPYTKEEFEKVGFECLVNDEGVSEELARFIVTMISSWTTDVRQAIMYGRACDNEEEVLEMLELDRERGMG